jgi:cell pole-organizing protein PopZ
MPEMPRVENEKDQSMEQILHTIRGVISGEMTQGTNKEQKEEEVFELTEIVKDAGSQPANAAANSDNSTITQKPNDILSDIDNILGMNNPTDEKAPVAEAKPVIEPNVASSQAPEVMVAPKDTVQQAVEASPIIDPNLKESVSNQQSINIENKAAAKVNEAITDNVDDKNLGLLSEESAITSAKAFRTLVKALSKPTSDGFAFRSGATVEDLVVEVLRPYLKEWMDKNLPTIVKHLVEKEIKKLIPRDED